MIQLEAWPSYDGVAVEDDRWIVVGSLSFYPVSNVTIEHLTIDGNWSELPVHLLPLASRPVNVALHGLQLAINGPVDFRNVTVTGMYGDHLNGFEGIALGCQWSAFLTPYVPIDPLQYSTTNRATFIDCTIHGGFGDFCAGIVSFNAGPTLISGCTIYSLANLHSGAIQVMGRDILISNCFVRDCRHAFYADKGNILELTLQNNRFISNGPGPIFADGIAQAILPRIKFWENCRVQIHKS